MFFNKVSLQLGQTNFKNASINLIPYHSQIKKKKYCYLQFRFRQENDEYILIFFHMHYNQAESERLSISDLHLFSL